MVTAFDFWLGWTAHTAVGGYGKLGYACRRPENTVLYQIVEKHVGPFFEAGSEQGASRPFLPA